MKIYLMQHGKPVPKEQDPDRPLSERGRIEVEQMADFLIKAGVLLEDVFHSGKTRARQTAEIMASKLLLGKQPLQMPGLLPLDDPCLIIQELSKKPQDFMIVGHLPHLAKITALLITGSRFGRPVAVFQQGGVVCLLSDEEKSGWAIAWMLVPEIIAQ